MLARRTKTRNLNGKHRSEYAVENGKRNMEVFNLRQVGGLVVQARKAKRLTQRALAKESSVSERTISSLEMGDATGIAFDKLMRIFDVLDLQMSIRSGKRVKLGLDELPHEEFDLVSLNDSTSIQASKTTRTAANETIHETANDAVLKSSSPVPIPTNVTRRDAPTVNLSNQYFTDFSETLSSLQNRKAR